MAAHRLQRGIEALLQRADVRIGGDRPWDLQVHDDRLYRRVWAQGSLGLGEAYIEGWWDCSALDELFYRVLAADLDREVRLTPGNLLRRVQARLLNLQNRRGARVVAHRHYDLPAEHFMAFLDPYNQYSCGYFQGTEDLAAAQQAKLHLICRKLGIREGDRLLDIGCGWGGLARFAAETYGARVTAINISEQQLAFARELTRGLPVEVVHCDYRDCPDLGTSFDKVVSVGMFEHVGYKNYRLFMEAVGRCLVDGGLFLLHTIGGNRSVRSLDPWLQKYIFPRSMLPSIRQISAAAEGIFVMEDWHSLGAHYDKTLMAWFQNFHQSWPRFQKRFGERFYRIWKYYLLSCAGSFRARRNQLWQVVFSKGGVSGGYVSAR